MLNGREKSKSISSLLIFIEIFL